MTCGFMGHRDAPNEVKKIMEAMVDAVIEKGVKDFYVGNNGNFDLYAQQVLERRCSKTSLQYYILLSFPFEKALSGMQERTLYTEGLEKTPLKFAIAKRNDYLIKKSDVLIVYQKYSFSNCYKLVERALRAGKIVINLAEVEKWENFDFLLDKVK